MSGRLQLGAVLVIFCVRDSASQLWSQPFSSSSVGEARRGFSDECNREGSQYFRHPEDFELYELGLYDEADASFSLNEKPRLVTRAVDEKIPSVVKMN